VLYKRDLYSAKETYIFKESTKHSHAISLFQFVTDSLSSCTTATHILLHSHTHTNKHTLSLSHTHTHTYTHTNTHTRDHMYANPQNTHFVCKYAKIHTYLKVTMMKQPHTASSLYRTRALSLPHILALSLARARFILLFLELCLSLSHSLCVHTRIKVTIARRPNAGSESNVGIVCM